MPETPPPDPTTTILYRIGLAGAGGLFIYLAALFAGAGVAVNSLFFVIGVIVLSAAGFFLLLSAGGRQPPPYLRWFILAAYMMQVITQAVLWAQSSPAADPNLVDSGLYTDLAATLIRHGQNPYTWDYGGIFDIRRAQQSNSTPLLNGASESPYPYPALPFLLAVPLQALGLPGVFTLSILAHMAMLALTFIAAPRQWQPVILLPALAGYDFGFLTVIGNLDILWALALLGLVIVWRHPTLRATFYGIALSLKQSPLLLAPFLLIRLWYGDEHHPSLTRVAQFVLISAATFLIINSPFILWNPVAWFNSYTVPVRDTLVIISHGGLSTLTQSGLLYLPKSFFLIATLSVFGLLIFVYLRHYDQLRDAFWILPGIAMWFSFRALVSYWLYWAFPMILVTVMRQPPLKPAGRPLSWRPTIAVTVMLAAALFTVGAVLASPVSSVQIKLRLPMFARDGAVNRLVLEVTNPDSSHTLTPRFAVQSRSTTTNPLPWYIEEGPQVLPPGQSAVYTITSGRADRTFYGPEPVQLVVTDAGGDYSLRGVLALESDHTYLWPDMIPNADYRLWDTNLDVPFSWQKLGPGSASLVSHDGRIALRLAAESGSAMVNEISLSNTIIFPADTFGIWLYPPQGDTSVAYGLEISDGEHRLWILFGPQAYTGLVDEGVYAIHRTVPAGAWVYQEIDLHAIYSEAGWSLPIMRRVLFRDLDMDAQVIQLGLMVVSDRNPATEGFFGPIIQSDDHPEPQALMAETLNDPAGYYQRLGRTYERDRNPTRALEAYQHALDFAPRSRDILSSIERLEQRLAEEAP